MLSSRGSPHLPGDLPNPGIEPTSPTLTGEIFTISTAWEAHEPPEHDIKKQCHLQQRK